jgi:hypothetical protein
MTNHSHDMMDLLKAEYSNKTGKLSIFVALHDGAKQALDAELQRKENPTSLLLNHPAERFR